MCDHTGSESNKNECGFCKELCHEEETLLQCPSCKIWFHEECFTGIPLLICLILVQFEANLVQITFKYKFCNIYNMNFENILTHLLVS